MTAATGFASGDHAVPELAAMAVKDALTNAGSDYAHSVVLFLSGHFAHHAQPAVTAASRAARCLQVSGCTVPGVFTEKAWALDQPAAAALVLCGDISLGTPRNDEARLTFALPSKMTEGWASDGRQYFGTLATDREGEMEGQVWSHGRVSATGCIEAALHGGRPRIAVSRGLRILTPLLEVMDSDSFEILQLDDETALDSLLRHLDPDIRKLDVLPPQRIFAAIPEAGVEPAAAMENGRYALLPILRVSRDERSVTLAAPLPLHSRLWWVLRDPASAERDMLAAVTNLDDKMAAGREQPAFGLMFSCIGRGPYFYQGGDRDVAIVQEKFPRLPLIGAYCAGEIAPFDTHSNLISYSSVIAMVTPDV